MNFWVKNLPKPIAIVGMARSGNAALRLLQACGLPEKDIVTFDDKLGFAQFCNPTQMMATAKPKTLLVSPGVPLSLPWIRAFAKEGGTITSELSVGANFLTTEKVIGITGSVGKSTTVSLLGAGLLHFSSTGFVGGNLGTPLCEYILNVVRDGRIRADWVILELSSYQLENFAGLNFDISGITYFSPNHLERYPDLDSYYRAKWNIVNQTTGPVFLNKNGGDLTKFTNQLIANPKIIFTSPDDPNLAAYGLSECRLIGQHNLENLAVAARIAHEAKWPSVAFDGMKKFPGLSHRLENLGVIRGIRFVNDSKATSMDSVKTAVHSVSSTLLDRGTLYVLLGGKDKNLPWGELAELSINPKVKFLFFGQCRELAQAKSKLEGPSFQGLGMALDFIFPKLISGDTLLLSPGGSSLDEFNNFEDRGDFFSRRVRAFFA